MAEFVDIASTDEVRLPSVEGALVFPGIALRPRAGVDWGQDVSG